MATARGSGVARIMAIAVLGAAILLAISYAVSRHAADRLAERLLAQEGLVKQEFLESILAAEKTAGALFEGPAPSPALLSFGAHVRSLPGIVRANIYSPDGVIRHSTEANLVGVHFSDNPELAQAFEGQITSGIEEAGEEVKAEHLALGQTQGARLIEAYIPVRDSSGKVSTVVEFYRREGWIREAVAEAERGIWITGAAGSAIVLLMGLLFGLRRR